MALSGGFLYFCSPKQKPLKLTAYILLLLSGVAITTWGVLVALRQKHKTGEEYFTLYLLLLVFSSIFGLYGHWASGFIIHLLAAPIESSLLNSILKFLNLLSLPFLLATWMTLIRIISTIVGRKWSWLLTSAIVAAALILIVLALLFPLNLQLPLWVPKSEILVVVVLHLGFCFYAGIALLFFPQEKSVWAESRPIFWLGFAFLLQAIMQTPAMACQHINFWIFVAFMLLFFVSLPVPILILMQSPLIRKKQPAAKEDIKGFRAFCLKYEISPREAEVVLEICKGKSNKEISDSLFISLQTVKDHAHNIFSKTGVKSRVQLANMVREVC